MKKVKNVLALINYNLKTLVGFEFIYKMLSLLIFMPLFLNLFNLITKLTGYSYLTFENFFSFLANPFTIILLIILFLFMMCFTLFDISTVIIILDASSQRKRISISEAFRLALKKCRGVIKLKNISIVFFVLFLIPFLNIGVSSSLITSIKIPEFIMDYIVKNNILCFLIVCVYLFLVSILLRWLYVFFYYTLEDKDFKEAKKSSINLSRKCHIKDLITLCVVQAVIFILYLVFLVVGILLILLVGKIFKKIIIIKSLTTTVIWLFIAFTFIILVLLGTPISYATISVMFYWHKSANNEKVKHISFKESQNGSSKWFKRGIVLVSAIALVVGFFFTYGLYKGKYNLNIEMTRTLEVTAHRGASRFFPENTMSAFKGAKDLGADFIELDVQETKDQQVIVIHDTNFQRTTGVNKNTWELSYDDVKKLDAGSFFAKEYKNERIPLLEEVVVFAKNNNIKLNIEIKPTGYEKNLEKEVVSIIKKYKFEDSCVITSQVYSVLEKVKKYAKDIKTVYVMSLAYGDITSLKYADNFSIEAMSVTKKIVRQVHKEGKELYVWTVNTKGSIKKMLDLKVDNIITDDITLAKEVIYSSKRSNIINEYVKLVQTIF